MRLISPWLFLLASLALAAWSGRSVAAPSEAPSASQEEALQEWAEASVADYHEQVQPLLEEYCYRCHGERRQRADVRVDDLDPDVIFGGDADGWRAVLDMINVGEMPPARQLQPTDEERRVLVEWMTAGLERAAERARGTTRSTLRRLTKAQYTHTLQDLLGIEMEFGRPLPDDGKSKLGFSNNGEVLQASPLHIETYQTIARQALGQAIAPQKPPVSHYRVTFGAGIGADKVAGTTGGYQSVPLSTDDFTVEVLDADGTPRDPQTDVEREALENLMRRITVGFRGSSRGRFRVIDEGLVMYSAVPHRETTPKSWQGPSPNMKLEMQRCFPLEGDFAFRVQASRGPLFPDDRQLLLELQDGEPLVRVPNDTLGVTPEPGALVVSAFETTEQSNLIRRDAFLVSEELTADSGAKLKLDVPAKGYYQIDLVHPPVGIDGMPSARLSLGDQNLDVRLSLSEEELKRSRVVTPLGAAHLHKGHREFRLGGPFFVGFSHLVLTPLSDRHPLFERLAIENDEASRAIQAERTPWLRVFAGTRTDDGMDYAAFDERREVTGELGSPDWFEFRGRLEDLPIPMPDTGDNEILSGIMVLGLWNDHLVKNGGDSGPPLLVRAVEFETPFFPQWPPASHVAIFGERPDRANPEVDTRRVIADFAAKAFRRPVTDAEVDRYVDFWQAIRADYPTWEDGVKEVLVAILCSPHFLYLIEPSADDGGPQPLDDHALATRLSMFLWNSLPDAELRDLADRGELRANLDAQVTRLLADDKSWRFVEQFSYEWLRLDRHRGMTLNPRRYPTWTRFVKEDMEQETYHFVREVLDGDHDLFAFIDSDFAMLNQNLAEYYGIEGVEGPEFRPVTLPADSPRGGLLGQGAFLAGHSDGNEAHPIKRAVWLKERILGDPPPPPPPNVPELDPEAPGFEDLTLKEQLEKHRDSASCMDCHAGIDPYGVVFEALDAGGRPIAEREGKAVDASTTLRDGTVINGLEAMRAHILDSEREAFTRALVRYLFSYALGRDAGFADQAELDAIAERVAASDYRFESVIRAIATSESFTRR